MRQCDNRKNRRKNAVRTVDNDGRYVILELPYETLETAQGGTFMKEKKKKLTLLLSEDQHAKLRSMAYANEESMSDLLRDWIDDADDPREKKARQKGE